MARLSAEAGAQVVTFATPPAEGIRAAGSVDEALAGARVAVGPLPLPKPDGRLYAPASPEPVYLRREALAGMAASAHIVVGRADPGLRRIADQAGLALHEYEHDTELMYERAPAIAEGAIALAIQRSPVTIHGTAIGVLGFGRTGRVLVQRLIALGAEVHVLARRREARAEARAMGASAHPLEGAPQAVAALEILFSTVPARVLTRDLLASLPRGALVLDLAAPPGSVNHEAARALGLDVVWARGLGASAARTVGRSQWLGVTRILAEALGPPPGPGTR
jgi:dipicolinate synthase subunit A